MAWSRMVSFQSREGDEASMSLTSMLMKFQRLVVIIQFRKEDEKSGTKR